MADLPLKALSIRQPWAWLIIHGYKDIENRTWRHRHRGPVLIHAGVTLEGEPHQALLSGEHPVTGEALPEEIRLAYTHAFMRREIHRGGIVGVASIADCVGTSTSPWFVGDFGFVLQDAAPLPFMPLKGMLGFFHAEYRHDQ